MLRFFRTAEGSIRGYVNAQELYRSVLTSLGAGSLMGLAILVLQAILSHASTIFPNPSTATTATMFLTLLLDLLRRQDQGAAP